MAVQRFQFLSALAQSQDLTLLYQAIPADVSDPLWIAFNSANCVAWDDVLATFVQSFYNLSDDDMNVIFRRAAIVPTGC
jgi:hypothetical protein